MKIPVMKVFKVKKISTDSLMKITSVERER